MRHIIRLVVIILLSLLAISSSYAQSDLERIRFATGETGTQITDTLTAIDLDRYVFRAFEGQTVFITAGSNASLSVFDPDGILLFTTISDVYQSIVLTQTGDYIVEIETANPTTTVTYTLDLQIYGDIGIQRNIIQRIQFAPNTVSTTLFGSVLPDAIDQYAFYAFANQVMTLTVGDASFYVVAPDETILAYTPEQAQNATLPLTGDYRIVVFQPSEITTESYSLTLTIIGETTGVTEPERIQFASGAISASIFDTVSGFDADEYVFGAAAGQNMTLAITEGTMTLVSPSGIPLVRGDVAEGIKYINLILPETGDYRVRVFRMADQPAVSYRLDLIIVN